MAFGFGFNKQKVLSAAEKFVQQGKLPNAITEYEKVLKADPKDLTVMNTVGDLYSRLGNSEKALECFKSVGDAYASQGFTVKAIAMYKKLSKLKASLECALRLAELIAEAGVPDGVVNVVPTSQPGPVTAAMLADPRVRKLSFTGSTEVGRILLREAADTVVNCSMELGGNAPFLVLEDADIDAAIDGAFLAKMRNGGEACTAANRFYVHDKVAAEFARSRWAKQTARLFYPSQRLLGLLELAQGVLAIQTAQ